MSKNLFAAVLLAFAPMAAHAGLTTISNPWPPAGSSDIESVLFKKVDLANGGFIAMGAHAYKNSAQLANNGSDTFYAQSGVFAGDGKNYANWSFDFAWDKGTCAACKIVLEVDKDPGTGINYQRLFESTTQSYAESWNMEMNFMNSAVYDFDPFMPSSTSFRLSIFDPTANGGRGGAADLGVAEIAVNVPEPGTMALTGLALAGLALARRRKK